MSSDVTLGDQKPNLRQTNLQLSSLAQLANDIDEGKNEPAPPSYEYVTKNNTNCPISGDAASNSQLPSYNQVAGLADAPPSYHSIFTDVVLRVFDPFDDMENQTPARVIPIYQNKIFALLINTFLLLVFIAFILVLPLAMIMVGFSYLHQCPIQKKIPMYLIVLGFSQMLECFGRIGYKVFQARRNVRRNSWRERCRRKDPLVYLVIIWFVVGSMWVYQTDPKCQDCNQLSPTANYTTPFTNYTTATLPQILNPKLYCHTGLYSFAFWVVTVYYSLVGFFCFLLFFDIALHAVRKCCCTRHIV